jgi:outer membrane protein assembly factor BamB
MSRPDGMQEVELVVLDATAPGDLGPGTTADGAGPGGDADRRRRRRRAVLRWWPLGVVAVAAVVGTEVVLDARERSRVAAAREVPGVVGYDVRPDLTAHPADPDLPTFGGVAVGDLRVQGAEPVRGEPRAVVAVDVRSGDQVWRTEVEDAARAAEFATIDPPWCSAGEPPVDRVVCVVQDRPSTDLGDGSFRMDPPLRTRLLGFDPQTGAVTAERELAPLASAHVVDGDLLLVEVVGDDVRVAAEDPSTDAVRWEAVVRAAPRAYDDAPGMRATDAHVLVHLLGQSWAFDRADGRLQVSGDGQLGVGRDERLISTAPDGVSARLHGADGTGDVATRGTPVVLDVDDGSVPGLDLLSDSSGPDRGLRAVDPATGEQVWEYALAGTEGSAFLLLDDVLYGGDAEAVWALDARDGREIWRTPRDDGDPADVEWVSGWLNLVTDGRQLLLAESLGDPADDAPAVLHAWSLTSGAHRWTAPLPPEAGGYVTVREHTLTGTWADPVVLR